MAATTLALCSAQAATTVIDFNEDPSGTDLFTLTGSAQWRPSGGESGGYLSITDAKASQSSTLIFKDLEDGLVIKSFNFEVDLRLGGGHAVPADGFSINYASVDDPLITGTGGFAGTDAETNLPEEGTQTGLAIGFDTWQSATINGVQDVVGVSVRVDNELIAQFPVPLQPGNVFLPDMPNPGAQEGAYVYDAAPYANLATNDANYNLSMQTGARADVDADGDVDDTDSTTEQPTWVEGDAFWETWVQHLTWETFRAEMTETGHVKVFWKGVELTPEGGLETGFTPRAGRIVFGGRTGGNWMATHIDNISLETQPFTSAVVQAVRGNAGGFVVEVLDQGTATLNPETVELTLNGSAVEVSSIRKEGGVSYVRYNSPVLLEVDSVNTVGISFEDNLGVASTATREFTVGAYTEVPAAFEVPASAVNTSGSGFLAEMHQIPVGRAPGDANSRANAERHLAGGFVDPVTDEPYPSMIPAGSAAGGRYAVDLVNWNQYPFSAGGTDIGNFQSDNAAPYNVSDEPLPGLTPGPNQGDALQPGYNDNIVSEIVAYLDLPAGFHTLGVNSDDGFRVSTSQGAGDVLGLTLGMFNGGKGSSDVLFDIYVPEAGYYPVRLIWWEGGSDANVEFFSIDQVTGQKVLINDRAVVGHIPAYPVATSHVPHVEEVRPTPGQDWVFADQDVIAEIVDGTVALNAGSATMTINGEAVQVQATKSGNITTVVKDSSVSSLLAGGLNEVVLTYSYTLDGQTVTVEDEWSFTVLPYSVVPAANAVAESDIDKNMYGFKAYAHQIDRTPGAGAGDADRFPGDSNRMPRPEIQLVNGYIDTATGEPFPNLVTPSGTADGSYDVFFPLNFNALGGDSGMIPGDSPSMPGLPGDGSSNGGNDNYVAEFLTYLELKAGAYVMGVNSDDGFVVSSSPNPRDTLGTVLGFYSGGRGSANPIARGSSFGVVIPEDGFYPFRVLYWNGGGGVNIEFVALDRESGRFGLVGDFSAPTYIPTYSTYTGPARSWVQFSVSPTPWDNRTQQAGPGPILMYGRSTYSIDAGDIYNWQDATRPFADVEIGAVLANASGSTIGMLLNGEEVTPSITTAGGDTTVSYQPAEPLPSGSTNTVGLIYEGVTNYWTFVAQAYADVPAEAALPLTAAEQGSRGFLVTVHQAATGQPTTVASAEARLAGEVPNVAVAGPVDGSYIDEDIINWNIQMNEGGNSVQIGNFQNTDLTGWPFAEYADEPVPGIPGEGVARDNIAAEVFAYIEFPEAGYYKLGINGDDGWAVTVAEPGVTDGTVLFTVDRSAGAADLPFSFTIPQAGLYPIRIVWYQGGGGGDLEFFSYGPDNVEIPVNSDDPNALRAFYSVEGGPVGGIEITSAVAADGSITIQWSGGGTLESAPTVEGEWTSTGDSDGSFTEAANATAKFYRVVQ